MKKLFMLLPVLGLSFLLCACSNSPADKAEDYAKQTVEAMKSGDLEKVQKLEKEMEEYIKTLSPEEQKEFEEAAEKYMTEHLGDAIQGAIKMGGALDEVEGLDDVDVDLDDADDALENAKEVLDDANDLAKKADDAIDALKSLED